MPQKTKNEEWMYSQIAKAHQCINDVLEQSKHFDFFERHRAKDTLLHLSMIDIELLQLLTEKELLPGEE